MFSSKNKIRILAVILLIFGILAAILDFPFLWNSQSSKLSLPGVPDFFKLPFRLGLDLQGGTHLLYEADLSLVPSGEQDDALAGVRDVIERRVNAYGVSEPLVQTSRSGDSSRIIVDLAGVKNVNEAIKMIGETPLLEFKKMVEPEKLILTEEQKKEMETFNLEAEKKAREVLQKVLQENSGFENLAKEFSQDLGSAQNGGSIGWAKRGQLVPEYERAIFDELKTGQISSDLVKTVYGFHIIKKVEQKGGPKPDGTDDTEVLSNHILIKTKSETDFISPQQTNWEYTGLTGKQLKRAQVQFDQNSNLPEVMLEFNDEGKDLFAKLTSENVGEIIGIFLDGQAISEPRVNEAIPNGQAVISGSFTIAEAKQLAQRLNAGALPVPIKLINQETIGASLGNISVQKSLNAGIIGFCLIIIFMLFYYRLLGFVSSISLIFYGVALLALFKIIPVTLSLAGIAGFILSLGMAVDANILIFERIKDELRNGRSMKSSIDEGFRRAWPSIRDGNYSTLITSFILMWFSTSTVKGFAVTLSLGILVSMFSALVMTRVFLNLAIQSKFLAKSWLFGVKIKTKYND
ncbi:protein translocase subunit SecD [Candidatus Parcubacteria bacterium]|nr:MAG: protein translocase subunit SecD [Candidatus Parcubacteria bacterium]